MTAKEFLDFVAKNVFIEFSGKIIIHNSYFKYEIWDRIKSEMITIMPVDNTKFRIYIDDDSSTMEFVVDITKVKEFSYNDGWIRFLYNDFEIIIDARKLEKLYKEMK